MVSLRDPFNQVASNDRGSRMSRRLNHLEPEWWNSARFLSWVFHQVFRENFGSVPYIYIFHLLINGVYWGYKPLIKHLLTSWDIQVYLLFTHHVPNKESQPLVRYEHDMTLIGLIGCGWWKRDQKIEQVLAHRIHGTNSIFTYQFPIPNVAQICFSGDFVTDSTMVNHLSEMYR